jgi:hypothetical protein
MQRRTFLTHSIPALGWAATAPLLRAQLRSVPEEPLEIGKTPQFFVDDYIVDNRWAVNFERGSKELVLRSFHPPRKHAQNPLISPERRQPLNAPQEGASWIAVLRDEPAGLFRMWYQNNLPRPDARPGEGGVYTTAICYAESKDGLQWNLPKLGLIDMNGSKDNNAVYRGASGRRASGGQILRLSKEANRGYAFAMLYLDTDGIRLVGSQDGIRWDRASDTRLHRMHSDFPNNVVWDPVHKLWRMYCRSKHIYRVGRGDILDTGESRRISMMTSRELWADWINPPQTILAADELDAEKAFCHFYAMMVQRHADIYWGFLHPFKWNTDMLSELCFSRDGIRFDRLPARPRLIDLGTEGAWDSGMTITAYEWVEVGDEWWLYYNGWDGPHGAKENVERGRWRVGGIGLATLRKEGFVSMRGPKNGGVLATRRIRWPGGGLRVNADARQGELKVRVSDELRKPVPGFDYKDCAAFTGDRTAHEVAWGGRSLDTLKDRVVRLEFFLKEADLYTFRAT